MDYVDSKVGKLNEKERSNCNGGQLLQVIGKQVGIVTQRISFEKKTILRGVGLSSNQDNAAIGDLKKDVEGMNGQLCAISSQVSDLAATLTTLQSTLTN